MEFEINSKEFMDQQFAVAWEKNNGPAQTLFFGKIALQYSPHWFIEYIYKKNLSLCDFGCALGDSVALFSECFPKNKIKGIDISKVAIEKARCKFPDMDFSCLDIFDTSCSLNNFDIIFSSNVLEHFYDPWKVANQLTQKANKFLWFLVPFYDDTMIDHFYTFKHNNILHQLDNNFKLICFTEIDTSLMTPNYWHGRQILLIYATTEQISLLENENIAISVFNNDSLVKHDTLIQRKLKEKTQESFTIIAEMENKSEEFNYMKKQLHYMEHSISWRITRPIRFIRKLIGIKSVPEV